jgi:hypothetical protein
MEASPEIGRRQTRHPKGAPTARIGGRAVPGNRNAIGSLRGKPPRAHFRRIRPRRLRGMGRPIPRTPPANERKSPPKGAATFRRKVAAVFRLDAGSAPGRQSPSWTEESAPSRAAGNRPPGAPENGKAPAGGRGARRHGAGVIQTPPGPNATFWAKGTPGRGKGGRRGAMRRPSPRRAGYRSPLFVLRNHGIFFRLHDGVQQLFRSALFR